MSTDKIQNLFRSVREDEIVNTQARLLYLIHEVSRHISTRFDQSMVRHRITHVQWWAMMHIGENQGVTQSEFANLMQMGRAPAGKLLERLEAKDWIERRYDTADHRVRRIYLSGGATPVFEAMTKEANTLYRDLLGNLPDQEVANILAGLLKIKTNTGKPLAP